MKAQLDFFEAEGDPDEVAFTKGILDRLLTESKLYQTSKEYKELLDFVVRLRTFAPYNAMLLQIQKPGLVYAASLKDWQKKFGRFAKGGTRPLLILLPFGPVGLVYDVVDTDGLELPRDVFNFPVHGVFDGRRLESILMRLGIQGITSGEIDAGDGKAGSIRRIADAKGNRGPRFRIEMNRNHSSAVRFATLAHELAHLFLGHLGSDDKFKIKARPGLGHPQEELEAESVAYMVCLRSGVELQPQPYLSIFLQDPNQPVDLPIYLLMKVANQVESIMGLSYKAEF